MIEVVVRAGQRRIEFLHLGDELEARAFQLERVRGRRRPLLEPPPLARRRGAEAGAEPLEPFLASADAGL